MAIALRNIVVEKLATVASSQLKIFAGFLMTPGPREELPCWGALREFASTSFDDEDWIRLWDVLLEIKNHQSLLVVAYLCREKQEVMASFFDDLTRIPVEIQRALVCFAQNEGRVRSNLKQLCPSAAQLWIAGSEKILAEYRNVEMQVSRLMSSRYFVPMTRNPAIEPDTKLDETDNDNNNNNEDSQ